MKTRLAIILSCSVVASSLIFWQLAKAGGVDSISGLWFWVKVYQESLRSPLFTGFFTLGGFLLTLKSAILMRIKEIYETEDYCEKWEVWREQNRREGKSVNNLDEGYYSPLRNLGIALMANVILALFSSFLQMSVGFINAPSAVAVCLGFAITSIGLVIFLSFQISGNLMMWFEHIEKQKEIELETRRKKKMPPFT